MRTAAEIAEYREGELRDDDALSGQKNGRLPKA
jgi:hypothetical protein